VVRGAERADPLPTETGIGSGKTVTADTGTDDAAMAKTFFMVRLPFVTAARARSEPAVRELTA